MVLGSEGLSHLPLETLILFVLEHWFRTGFERGLWACEKGGYHGLGFWCPCGFDPIAMCIKTGY